LAEHYFSPEPSAEHAPREVSITFEGKKYTFLTDAGVFSRDGFDEGSALMLSAALDELSGDVLDLGCGWGPVGILAAKLCPDCRVTLLDVNARACHLAAENARRHGVNVQVLCQDGLSELSPSFDWILLNPPIRAGKETVYRLFRESSARLKPSGCLVIVIRKQQGAPSARRYLETLFSQVTLRCRKKSYHVYFCLGGNGNDI
jgi:16S rRNA (guanine1207-N2)-methyltransferase